MVYVFGDYELDTERIELRRSGATLAVEPQVFDVLAYLVAHRDRVVTKNELLDNVWGDRFVSESALTSRIKAARRLCGDDGRAQAVIRTSHGRGYRFVAAVAERDGADDTPSPDAATASATRRNAAEHTQGATAVVEPVVAARSAWPLLGRGVELDTVARCFADRRVGGVLFTGVAGLGKTRLADECLVAAAAGRVATARVTGNPEAANVSLGALAHLVPADIVALVGPDGELDRTTLFHRARSAVTSLAPEGERLMMLVDDIDHLDELSRALIGSLVVDGEVFAIITMRSGQAPVPIVDHLQKDGRLRAVALSPLGPETVETLLHRVLGGPMVTESTTKLVDASLGNPGVLRQLVDTARRSGALVESHGVWHLVGPLEPSTSLETLVAERLRGVEGEALHAVELLAVAGHLGVDLLTDLVGADGVDELDRLGIAELRSDRRRHDITLAHPMFGEVIRQQMSSLRSRRVRRELADAVDHLGARRRDDQVRVVAWRLEGGGQLDQAAVVRAARLAMIDRNHEMAMRLLERAVEQERTPEAVQLLAELHFRLGHTALVEELLAGIDRSGLDDQRRAVIARRRANNRFFGTTDYQGSFELLTEAIATTSDPAVARALEATLAQLLVNGGQITESLRRSESTLDDVDGAVRLEALRARALAMLAAGRPDDALAAALEARRLHAESANIVELPGLTMVLFCEALALAEAGRIQAARQAIADARVSYPHAQPTWLSTALGRIELLAGQPRAVRRAVAPVVHESRARGLGAAERWVIALHACACLLEGELGQATDDVERATSLEDGPRGLFHPDIDRAKAWLFAHRGDLDAALAQLHWSADDARQRGAHAFELVLLHDIARFGGAPEVHARCVELATQVQGSIGRARIAYVAGLATGRADDLTEAADTFEQCGARVYAAEAALAVGEQERAESLRTVAGVRVVTPALDQVV